MNPKNNNTNNYRRPSTISLMFTSLLFAVLIVGNLYSWLKNIEYRNHIKNLEEKKENTDRENDRNDEEKNKDKNLLNKENLLGDYEWADLFLQTKYSKVAWNNIVTDVIGGLSPKIFVIEKSSFGDRTESFKNYESLKDEGCMFPFYSWLEKKNGEKIDTKEKLMATFGPVESEAEAVSFVGLTESYLQIKKSVPKGHSLTIDGGFLVQIVNYDRSCGCGGEPREKGFIYKVNNSGEIKLIAEEILPPTEKNDVIVCID